MAITIRPATPDDYEGLLQVLRELDEHHLAEHPELFRRPDGPSRAREYIEELIQNPDKFLLVAEEAGAVLGFAEGLILRAGNFPVLKPRSWVHLDNIAVLEARRGCGIGKLLLAEVRRWAAGRGLSRIELKVYRFNEGARAFYDGQGFRELSANLFWEAEPGE